MSDKYPKIYGPFKRFIDGPRKGQFDIGNWMFPEFEALADLPWQWTEKINGMNVRVIWDGYKVTFAGRGDNARWPLHLLEYLQKTFSEYLLEQQFGSTPAILYGEGHGANVVEGSGVYGYDPGFTLFDVKIGGFWLERSSLVSVSNGLAVPLVPLVLTGPISQAIDLLTSGLRSDWSDRSLFHAEGLVGKAPSGLLNRKGEPIWMKIKTEDFFDPEVAF